MRRVSLSAIAATGILLTAYGAQAEGQSYAPSSSASMGGSAEICEVKDVPAPYTRATSFSSSIDVPKMSRAIPVADLTDEEFARKQAEFEARFPSAPSLNDTSSAAATPQYEERSATNVFPYSKSATGLSPSGKLALYHIGVGVVGADLITHPQSVGLPPTLEYNIPHLPQEEPLWCWAAAAQQAIGWVNKGYAPTQCAIVALAHGLNVKDCCGDREGMCARTGEIPAIGRLVSLFGGQAFEMATVPRTPKEVYRIVEQGQTLLIRLRPAPNDQAAGIRHMIVVRGIEWTILPNQRLGANLLYNDPLGSGIRSVSFDTIVGFFEQALIVRRKT